MMVYMVASTERLLILASAISKSNVLAHGTENIQGMSGLSLCDLSSPSLCFSVGFHRPAPSTWEPQAKSPPVSSPSSEKGRLLFARKGAGLDSCVCGVSRGCKLEPALWPEGGSDWPGPARGGRGHPFPALEPSERFPGESQGSAHSGSGGGKPLPLPPAGLCPPHPQPRGGRRNFHSNSNEGWWCCGREHPAEVGAPARAPPHRS